MADYLVELDEQYRAGQMTPTQRERYSTLLGELKAALPTIERPNLRRPWCVSTIGCTDAAWRYV